MTEFIKSMTEFIKSEARNAKKNKSAKTGTGACALHKREVFVVDVARAPVYAQAPPGCPGGWP